MEEIDQIGVPGDYRIQQRGEVGEIEEILAIDWFSSLRPNPLLRGKTFR